METLHLINIIIHVVIGTLALLAGLIALSTSKGGRNHVQVGKIFLKLIAVVILTGLVGVFIFQRNTFLLVITLLSGYTSYSGIRALKLRGRKPLLIDYVIPVIVLASGFYYLYYINSIGMFWAPVIIYSTLGALAFVTLFDLLKVLMPLHILRKTYIYEHVYKMTSSFVALASAFTGTVLPQYHPYSQILPTVFGLIYIIITFISLAHNKGLNIPTHKQMIRGN